MEDQTNNNFPRIIDTTQCVVMTPTITGEVEAHYCGGMVNAASERLLAGIAFVQHNSDISSARGKVASRFLDSGLEWLICIDADIGFMAQDLRYLLSVEPDGEMDGQPVTFTRNDKGEELIVVAEYPKKNAAREVVRFGLGFCRFHRSVFERLDNLRTSDTDEELIARYRDEGKLRTDYYPSFCSSDQRKMPEDVSFWTFVRLAGISPRIERRCNLYHYGKKAYSFREGVVAQ